MTNAMSGAHVLVITDTPWADGGEEGVERDYEIECPGVVDSCRRWEGCQDAACTAVREYNPNSRDALSHGVPHRWIAGEWMIATDGCHVALNDEMPSAAESLAERHHLGEGRYPVDFDFYDESGVFLLLIDEPVAA